MKKILLIFIIIFNLNAGFLLKYNNITVGEINNINTIYDGYLMGKCNFLGKSLTNNSYFILYNNNNSYLKFNGEDFKIKKDNFGIIETLKYLFKNKPENKIIINLENNSFLNIYCSYTKEYCNYKRVNIEQQIISDGYLIFKNNELMEICDTKSKLCLNKF